jgi:hypothetical protein
VVRSFGYLDGIGIWTIFMVCDGLVHLSGCYCEYRSLDLRVSGAFFLFYAIMGQSHRQGRDVVKFKVSDFLCNAGSRICTFTIL